MDLPHENDDGQEEEEEMGNPQEYVDKARGLTSSADGLAGDALVWLEPSPAQHVRLGRAISRGTEVLLRCVRHSLLDIASERADGSHGEHCCALSAPLGAHLALRWPD